MSHPIKSGLSALFLLVGKPQHFAELPSFPYSNLFLLVELWGARTINVVLGWAATAKFLTKKKYHTRITNFLCGVAVIYNKCIHYVFVMMTFVRGRFIKAYKSKSFYWTI